MSAQTLDKSSVLIDKVIELIHNKLSKSQAKQVELFTRHFYGSVGAEDLANRLPSDLYASILSLWNFIQTPGKNGVKLRVLNPDFEKHGWQSKHTVIELLNDDMPFLVDSVRMELNRLGITTHFIIHLPLVLEREKTGRISSVKRADSSNRKKIETPMYIEVDRQTDESMLKTITKQLKTVLGDVRTVVSDWEPMKKKLGDVIKELSSSKAPMNEDERNESISFLKWISNNHFTLMGYSVYGINAVDGGYELVTNAQNSLGLQKKSKREKRKLSSLPLGAQRLALDNTSPLIITKTSTRSTVHRPAYVDYIGVKRFDENGKVIGEHRFLGLYTADAYNISSKEIPVLRKKLNWVIEESGLTPQSHDIKALGNILETYPRDELFQVTSQELLETSIGILHMQERPVIKLFIRRDPYGRFFSCMVYVPREQYITKLRIKMMAILKEYLNGCGEVLFTTHFSESIHARTHYIVNVENSESIAYDIKVIERELREASRSWNDNLYDALKSEFGEDEGSDIGQKYAEAFLPGYMAESTPLTAVLDIKHMESLSDKHPLSMILYRPQEDLTGHLKFKLYHRNKPAVLSDVLPMLENMGLSVMEETPYRISPNDGVTRWILDFNMHPKSKDVFDLEVIKNKFQDAFYRVWTGQAENDGFNSLILTTGLNWREVSILRTIAKYLWQIGFTFSQFYIESTFSSHPTIARMLAGLFKLKFCPETSNIDEFDKAVNSINTALTTVSNIDEDRIINRYVEVIKAIVRTNFYQVDSSGNSKPQLSFKLEPTKITGVPEPVPAYEIFVYSPRFEGVHLRSGTVARGGLRWSDRREDFRTEILGLVKAQQVKNAVIVPVGSKGGFVCKMLPENADREAIFTEGQACYRGFIRGMLDITDNIVEGEIEPPKSVIRYDTDDPYLVVAADKGTATFSDIANAISEEYNFWLADAFASGGSQGYDHKKMGITAKGAWESVKRHFREMGIDCQKEEFTCLAIGDMGGDVFGNGMLLSKHTRLVGAFNHLHILIDPTPDAMSSYEERERLFNMPRSSWSDYERGLISEGGGIFDRKAKLIKLSPQIKKLINSNEESMAPNQLIKSLLKSEYDLLWNGGIGTYVKAKKENDSEVGDKTNDPLRVNGEDLRCKIVGEGGNLGLTQLGRIEYNLNGGRSNTDFIDNVGGVDCSDHEVNIKILLNGIVASGDMTMKQRNRLLQTMTDEVGKMVLNDNYAQIQSISIIEKRSHKMIKELMRFIHTLERSSRLNRELEFLPSDEELIERVSQGRGLSRAELCVLTAYGKMSLKDELNTPEITENPYFNSIIINYFPKPLHKEFLTEMESHRLGAQIIATQLANDMVNFMGCNFALRMHDETGATYADIAVCFTLSREIFQIDQLWHQIESLDNKISSDIQIDAMFQTQRMIRRATRWFLRHRNKDIEIKSTILYFSKDVQLLQKNVSKILESQEAREISKEVKALMDNGMPESLAKRVAYLSTMFSALDIVELTKTTKLPVALVAEVYYKLGANLQLHWFLEQITKQPVDNHWQAFARSAFREELDWQQRGLALVVLESTPKYNTADEKLAAWIEEDELLIRRWMLMVADFRATSLHEFAKFSVALRELLILVQSCIRTSL